MKSYFEWQTPAGFRPKKSTESLKKAFKPALLEAVFSICILGVIILLWFVLGIERGSTFSNLFVIFGILTGIVLIFPQISLFAWIPITLRFPPKSQTKIRLTENKIIFGKGRSGFWEYTDIQSFEIVQDQFQGMVIPVLELENFDGRGCSLGISQEISVQELNSFLYERICAARIKARNLNVVKGTVRQRQFGYLLLMFGMIGLLFFSVRLWNMRSIEKQSDEFKAELTKQVAQLESQKVGKEQIELYKKVFESYLSAELLAIRNMFLIGMFGSISVFLLGGVLTLWGNNKYLKNKISRLQAYLPDKLENTGAKQESTA